MGWPGTAGLPLTVMRPAAIQASTWRGDATPRADRTFWMRSRMGSPARRGRAASARGVGVVGGRLACGRRLHRHRLVELELDADVVHVAKRGKRRQLIEAAQAEVVEEIPRGAEKLRMAGHFPVPDDADPAALRERADDVRVDRHAAHVLDLAARDRLPVRDERERLQQRARVARGPLLPEPREARGKFLAHLQPEPARHFDELHGAPVAVVRERGKRLADLLGFGPLELFEEPAQLLDAERLAVSQQSRLDDALELSGFHVGSRQAVVTWKSSTAAASGSRSTRRTYSGW